MAPGIDVDVGFVRPIGCGSFFVVLEWSAICIRRFEPPPPLFPVVGAEDKGASAVRIGGFLLEF